MAFVKTRFGDNEQILTAVRVYPPRQSLQVDRRKIRMRPGVFRTQEQCNGGLKVIQLAGW